MSLKDMSEDQLRRDRLAIATALEEGAGKAILPIPDCCQDELGGLVALTNVKWAEVLTRRLNAVSYELRCRTWERLRAHC